jgi:hypothetical protein
MKRAVAKTEDGFDRLARMMKEGFDDVETNLRKEIDDVGTGLSKEIRDVEERLQYRVAKVSTDIYHHLNDSLEPQLHGHETRIKKLERPQRV